MAMMLEFKEELQATMERQLADHQVLVDSWQHIASRVDNLAARPTERTTRRPGLESVAQPAAIRSSAATVPERTTRRPGLESVAHPAAIRPSATTVPERTTRRPGLERVAQPAAIRPSAATVPERTTRRPGLKRATSPVAERMMAGSATLSRPRHLVVPSGTVATVGQMAAG